MHLKRLLLAGFFITEVASSETTVNVEPVTLSETGCSRALVTTRSDNFDCLNQWAEETIGKVNCEVQFAQPVLPDRKMRLLKNGQLDFAIGLSKTSKRLPHYLFSHPIYHTAFGIFGAPDTQHNAVHQLCDAAMQNSHLIIPDGYYISDEMDTVLGDKNCYKSLQKTPMTGKKALEMLIAGRAELIVLPENYVASLQKADKVTADLYRHPVEIYGEPVHIAFSKATIDEDFLIDLNITLTQDRLEQLAKCFAGK